jgi:GxxExxY protein
MELKSLTERVIGCAIEVHRALGPGFLEGVYERALLIELHHTGLKCSFQKESTIYYRGEEVGTHRYDILVEDSLVVELKAVKSLENIHFAQVRSYLKALDLRHGLLLNFGAMPLTIKRVILDRGREDSEFDEESRKAGL